jgi:hypothetical protein
MNTTWYTELVNFWRHSLRSCCSHGLSCGADFIAHAGLLLNDSFFLDITAERIVRCRPVVDTSEFSLLSLAQPNRSLRQLLDTTLSFPSSILRKTTKDEYYIDTYLPLSSNCWTFIFQIVKSNHLDENTEFLNHYHYFQMSSHLYPFSVLFPNCWSYPEKICGMQCVCSSISFLYFTLKFLKNTKTFWKVPSSLYIILPLLWNDEIEFDTNSIHTYNKGVVVHIAKKLVYLKTTMCSWYFEYSDKTLKRRNE